MQLEKAHSSSCHQEKRLWLSSSPGIQKESDDTDRGCRRAETGGIWTKSAHERKQQSKNSQPGSWWLVLVKRNIFINWMQSELGRHIFGELVILELLTARFFEW